MSDRELGSRSLSTANLGGLSVELKNALGWRTIGELA